MASENKKVWEIEKRVLSCSIEYYIIRLLDWNGFGIYSFKGLLPAGTADLEEEDGI